MHYRARYYNPGIGRFVSEDPLRLDGGINFYAYVLNDPINYRDPSGLDFVPFLPPTTTGWPPSPPQPGMPSCPREKNCDKYGKGSRLYKICMGMPNACWSNCVRKCLLDRYEKHGIIRYLFIDHPICFYVCPGTCTMI